MTRFPWDEAMRFGFGVMKLSSQQFWSLTPRELAAAFSARAGARARPPGRSRLGELMERFPDEQ